MHRELSDYFRYLRDIVGVGSVLMPIAHEDPHTLAQFFDTRSGHWPAAGEIDLLVLVEAGSPRELWQDQSEALWDKMKLAMKLSGKKTLEVQTNTLLNAEALHQLLLVFPATVLLVMKSLPARGESGHKIVQSSHLIETFLPSTLVENPELKRESWTDLQGVMKLLSNGHKN